MTKERRSESDEAPVDLTEAARAVVRDPGDPRIDAHLAALGLGLDADRGPTPGPRARGGSAAPGELAELRRQVDELEGQLEASQGRIRALAVFVGGGALVIVLLLVALFSR